MNNSDQLPRNHVLAVLDDAETAHRAAQDLIGQGFANAEVFRGDELEMSVDANNEHSNVLARLIKSIPNHLSDMPEYLAQYQELAKSGRSILAVAAEGTDQAAVVRDILLSVGAYNIRFFGTLAVTDLSMPSNPNVRDDVRPTA